MKAFLLHPTRDVELTPPTSRTSDALIEDLGLTTLLDTMAAGDTTLRGIALRVLLHSETDPAVITYRQNVLADVLRCLTPVQSLYNTAVEAINSERKVVFGLFRDSPDTLLRRSVQVIQLLLNNLHELRAIGDDYAQHFHSSGFHRLFRTFRDELGDDYLKLINQHLEQLQLHNGVLMSAELGPGNAGTRHIMHHPPEPTWWQRLTGRGREGYGFDIAERDEQGARDLRELASRGIDVAAQALTQSANHVVAFFERLRTELGFYLACANLHRALDQRGVATCFPEAVTDNTTLRAHELRDPCLALTTDAVVGNSIDAGGKTLVVITGANQGGKSTFLRSIGIAQLMMQCGMFVTAESYSADLRTAVFTHFTRKEDASLTHGKLDDELLRMHEITETIGSGGLVLCNESFSSTNEFEGSEIADQVLRAFIESKVKVVIVTHLYDLARRLHRRRQESILFLRADRGLDGHRTFHLSAAPPEPTSHAQDSYHRIFETTRQPAPKSPPPLFTEHEQQSMHRDDRELGCNSHTSHTFPPRSEEGP